MKRPAVKGRQQGIAALTAILVVAIATVLAVNLLWHTSVDIRRTETLLAQDQARQYDLGAEEYAKLILAKDARNSSAGNVDSLDEDWAQPQLREFEAGTLEGQLTDLQGRFDLNSLVKSGDKRNDDKARQYEKLLTLLELERPLDPETAAALTDATIDWIDANTYQGPKGAEDDVYTSREPAYRPANFWFVSTSELLAIQGYTPEIYAALDRYVTALPPPTNGQPWPLNVNTAEAPVLEALLSGAGISAIIPPLPRGPYTDVQEFLNEINFTGQAPPNALGVSSSWFLLTVSTSVGETRSTMYSLLERNDQVVRTRLRSFDAN